MCNKTKLVSQTETRQTRNFSNTNAFAESLLDEKKQTFTFIWILSLKDISTKATILALGSDRHIDGKHFGHEDETVHSLIDSCRDIKKHKDDFPSRKVSYPVITSF